MQRLIGVDPGASGAIVMLEDGVPIEWTLMPTMKVGSATRVNGSALAKWFDDAHAEHGASADAHGATAIPLELVLNKYTLETKDGKDYRKLSVTGEDAEKLMKNMATHTLAFGANLSKNEYAVQQQYANFFFFITGFHGFHVFSGVMINVLIFFNVLLGTYEKRGSYEMVEKVGLYWHFVDLVWVFVFTFFYLV